MPLRFPVVLATAHLEDAYFVAAAVRKHFCLYSSTGQKRFAEFDVAFIADHQYFIQHDFSADIGRQLLDLDFGAGADTVLLAAGFDHCVHKDLVGPFDPDCRKPRSIQDHRAQVKGRRAADFMEKVFKIMTLCGMAAHGAHAAPDGAASLEPIANGMRGLRIAIISIFSACIVFLQQLQQLIAPDMAAVDQVIRSRLDSDVALVRQIAEYIVGSGGKRLRPALLVLSARALGYQGRYHHTLAAVVEFIHTATLLHDDVVDESALRRGRSTANTLFGNAASVLVGDFVYSRAFQMMVDIEDLRVLKVLADATNVIAEGEVLQLMNCRNPDVDESAYLRVIRYKTAKLFEASGSLGAILALAPEAAVKAMGVYGAHLGTAFQLVDDVLDYSGEASVTGKNVGDDLAEGKPTLPLIRVMQTGTGDEIVAVRRAIENGSAEHLDQVLAAIRRTGALDYARQRAAEEAGLAQKAIADLPDTPYRDSLLQLAGFAVTRTH
jgi:octaprenyl-diphosphate synthase